jgi:Putative auto-transporter adhesin, head GIN domain/Outer membrane protein beta-barrel domain
MKTMKNILMSLTAVCFCAVSLSAQNKENRAVGDFTGIRAGGATVVIITQSDSNTVSVEASSAKAAQQVITEVSNGILVISTEKAERTEGSQITVRIGAKKLNSIDASGMTSLKTKDTLITDNIRIQFSGASEGKIAIKATRIETQLSGASDVRLTGTTTELVSTNSGASELKAANLRASSVSITTSGASEARIWAVDSLSASASGASSIVYYGTPVNTVVNKSGSSEIEQRSGTPNAPASDTTTITILGKDVQIVDGEISDNERSAREKKSSDDSFKHWQGIDFGAAGILSADNQLDLPNGFEPFELNYAKSYVFGWNMFQKNIHIYRNNLNLGTGIGLTWYHYNFKGSYTLNTNVPFQTSLFDSTKSFSRNRFNMCYVNVPLMLEYNSNNNDAGRSFHVAAGMQVGYNIFKNKLKQRYEENGQSEKRVIKDNFNVNPFRIDAMARIGYGSFSIFGTYSLTSLFEREKGPVFYPFTAGIHFNFD